MLGQKLSQVLEKLFVCTRGHIFSPVLMKLGQNVFLYEMSVSLNLGHIGSETSSLGQILEKPYVCPRGLIFSLILMKLSQNVCLNEILDKFENGSCQVKN